MWFALALLVVLADAQNSPNTLQPQLPPQPQGSPMCPTVRSRYENPPSATVNCMVDEVPGICRYFPVKEISTGDGLLSWFANCVAQEIACGRENRVG
jgi:hypothetical protein